MNGPYSRARIVESPGWGYAHGEHRLNTSRFQPGGNYSRVVKKAFMKGKDDIAFWFFYVRNYSLLLIVLNGSYYDCIVEIIALETDIIRLFKKETYAHK